MPRNTFLITLSLLVVVLLSIPFFNLASADNGNNMKSIIIVSGYSGYTTHELEKADSFRNHLLESSSSDDIYYLTSTTLIGLDGEATTSNVEDAFSWLIKNSDSDTKVAIYIMDHVQMINSQIEFNFNNDQIAASTINGWLDDVTCSEMIVILNGEKSALAGPSLDTTSRDVICSMRSDQTYCPDYFDISSSLEDPVADANNDGTITYIEAFENEKDLLESSGQVPVLY